MRPNQLGSTETSRLSITAEKVNILNGTNIQSMAINLCNLTVNVHINCGEWMINLPLWVSMMNKFTHLHCINTPCIFLRRFATVFAFCPFFSHWNCKYFLVKRLDKEANTSVKSILSQLDCLFGFIASIESCNELLLTYMTIKRYYQRSLYNFFSTRFAVFFVHLTSAKKRICLNTISKAINKLVWRWVLEKEEILETRRK